MPLLRSQVKIVLMAGGRGERFWPRSTRTLPKQFLQVDGEKSLLRRTFERAALLVPVPAIYVVTGHDYQHLTRQELPELPEENLILEPVGRNTAPALGLAALWLERSEPDTILIALPSDHHITGEGKFHATLLAAVEAARDGHLVTVGVTPTRPETGYGYIHLGPIVKQQESFPVYRVARFEEKPDATTATRYVESGEYLWNSGMLICQTATLRQEIARYLPKVADLLRELDTESSQLADLCDRLLIRFPEMPSISIDYGVLERSDRVVALPAYFGWNDVGDWAALGRLLPQDEHGNTVQGDALLHDSHGLIVDVGSGRLVVTVGVNDLIVVDTPRAVLICAREQAQAVRSVARIGSSFVEALEQALLPEGEIVPKPWGREIWWAVNAVFRAKVLEVRAGHCLSLESGERSYETICCQAGMGRLGSGDTWQVLQPGSVVTLEPGRVQQLEARTPLTLITVATADAADVLERADEYGHAGGA
jgi:mannose-1-phosphate guanylyltransferase